MKIYYIKSNPLTKEYPNITSNPDYEPIPENLISFEEINNYVRENKGCLYHPTSSCKDLIAKDNSVLDFYNKSIKENIGLSIKLKLSRNRKNKYFLS